MVNWKFVLSALFMSVWIGLHPLSVSATELHVEDISSVEELPEMVAAAKSLIQAYADYNATMNDNLGTMGVMYYPCPDGYRCRDLIAPGLDIIPEKLVFDHCEGDSEECLILLTDLLIKAGVADVDTYLNDRRSKK